jgi:hypothetical protein
MGRKEVVLDNTCERLAELATKTGWSALGVGEGSFFGRANCSTGLGCMAEAQVFHPIDFQISLFRIHFAS